MSINQPFVINDRFLIDPTRHRITNLETQSESRMELRHIKLLCLLCINQGKLLERDFLIGEIWNNYSGADEALTQGISLLRKLLADEKKELIKTIPKKGYIFQGQISEGLQQGAVQGQPAEKKKPSIWVYSMLSGMVVLALLLNLLPMGAEQENIKPEDVASEKFNTPSASKPIPKEEQDRSGKHTSPPAESEKHTSPPPEGKDDVRKTTTKK